MSRHTSKNTELQEVDYKEIGNQIRRYRKKKKYTQAALAEKIGVTEQHFSHIELSRTKLSFPVLLAVSRALEVDINCLIGRNGYVADQVLKDELAQLLEKATPDEMALCLRLCRAVILPNE